MDYIDLGATPLAEPCVQLGDPNYSTLARPECQRFLELMSKIMGPEQHGCRLGIKKHQHDFGTYLSVVCWFDETNPEAEAWALSCETKTPEYWEKV
jgi:hypothetical protein